MQAHIHVHFDHNHDGLFSRVTRDLGAALDRLGGPAMSDQERLERAKVEAQNELRSIGVL